MNWILMILLSLPLGNTEHILMITMGGTKSHKIPFWELAKGLIPKGHRITLLSGFMPDFHIDGLQEVAPMQLVQYIHNYTNWDLVGARYAQKTPVSIWQALRYPAEACNSLLNSTDAQSGITITDELLTQKFHLAIADGAFPECALGLVHSLGIPFMYINTVGFYTGSLAMAGNPIVHAVTPHVFTAFTQTMNLWQRTANYVIHILADLLHKYYSHQVHAVLIEHLNASVPHPNALAQNVSFILQNGHAVVTNARPFYPNVAQIACLHCRPAGPLTRDLEEFIESAPAGVIYFSMGSSVRAANMPEEFRRLLVEVFARLPHYHVLWKWDGNETTATTATNATTHQNMTGLTKNVRLSGWLPQQDILGQRKLKAFITHGGLLSIYEAIYHATPMVVLPVFCDHDVNTAKAVADGYALRIPLEGLTTDKLYQAVVEIIANTKYKRRIEQKRRLLLDHIVNPLDVAVFWTEYVLRHQDVAHLQAPVRHMSFFTRNSLDVIFLLIFTFSATLIFVFNLLKCVFSTRSHQRTILRAKLQKQC